VLLGCVTVTGMRQLAEEGGGIGKEWPQARARAENKLREVAHWVAGEGLVKCRQHRAGTMHAAAGILAACKRRWLPPGNSLQRRWAMLMRQWVMAADKVMEVAAVAAQCFRSRKMTAKFTGNGNSRPPLLGVQNRSEKHGLSHVILLAGEEKLRGGTGKWWLGNEQRPLQPTPADTERCERPSAPPSTTESRLHTSPTNQSV
jgi:hypothetical protein